MSSATLTIPGSTGLTDRFSTLRKLAASRGQEINQPTGYKLASVSLDRAGEIIPEGKPTSPSGTTFVELMIYQNGEMHGGYAFEPEGNKGALERFETHLDKYNESLAG